MKMTLPAMVRRSTWGRAGVMLLGLLAVAPACGELDRGQAVKPEVVKEALTTCSATSVSVVDLHADFRDIWKGLEAPQTGKEATPNLSVGIDFSATVVPAQVTGQFLPQPAGGACGAAVPTVVGG
ncbi:MAG TPA: hypothetical protein VHU40_04790, partial [Polyangia bacterium]|nr:hypothetical protein [Polyangia bacterium]